jgi:hypothetical protein
MTQPENWVIVEINYPKAKDPFHRKIHKIFASWTDSYLGGDSWRLNSGIDRAIVQDETVKFYGYSGSCYECIKGTYGTSTSYTTSVLFDMINLAPDIDATIKILRKDTDWTDL